MRSTVLLAGSLLLAAGMPTAAWAEDPEVRPREKGVVVSGVQKQSIKRFDVVQPPPVKPRKGGPAKNPEDSPTGLQKLLLEDGTPPERGSCLPIGLTEADMVDRGCIDPPPVTPPVPERPVRPRVEEITIETVRAEVKNVDFPALRVQVEPRGRTLVNLKTNVYTKPVPVDQVVPVLTWPVGVRASATGFTWNFGDGTTLRTTSPGSPYPALDVVHQYEKRGKVAVNVVVHYTARYQVPGGSWTTLPGTVDITGPATSLTVAEARPVLVDPER